ncbi:MAG TPA: MFS transporter [Polyangiaceae bacterium]|nr:MFS transporter [Polyangiaceae bacterium]
MSFRLGRGLRVRSNLRLRMSTHDKLGDGRSAIAPIVWVPTAYIAEGIPFAVVIWTAGTMFKDFGRGDDEITLTTATLGVAWSLKPLWAPFLDMYRTKKFWVLSMQVLLGSLLAACALVLRLPGHFAPVVLVLGLLAFASATQDICIDGIYITSLDDKTQALWAGWQGTFWNVGRWVAVTPVVWLAGVLKRWGYDAGAAWTWAFAASAVVMASFALAHRFTLPAGGPPTRRGTTGQVAANVVETFVSFAKKPNIVGMLLFVFFYRAGEGLLLVEAPLFLQAPVASGGIGLTLEQKAFVDGTMSFVAILVGGLLGGAVVARAGLKRTLVPLALAMNVPHVCYIVLSQAANPSHPVSLHFVWLLVGIEKLGYSFGFVGNMVYMMQQIAPGQHKMSHYAICTALMNLVLVPTQMVSGPLAVHLGYKAYFLLVLVASIPSVVAAWLAPFPNASADD